MIKLFRALAAAGLFALSIPVAEGRPFDPASLRRSVSGQATEVLVLGTPHLSELEPPFDPLWLEPLLGSLEGFRPAAIVIESMPGEALQQLVAYDGIYPEVAEMFGSTRLRLANEAATRLSLTVPAAEAEARRLLESWPAAPTPSQRRRLAAMFIASGDLNSALVQWLRLDPAERNAADGIGSDAAAQLLRMSESRNEIVSIAVRLAVRLRLERVWGMDDQSETDLVFSDLDAVTAAEESPALLMARQRRPAPRFTPMTSPQSVVAAYREHNRDATGRRDAQRQWLARLEAGDHSSANRRRIAAWEARNLRMAANIREVSARHPGERILVLVGSAHKPYLEAYLRTMGDMSVVRAAEVIGRGR